jgi:hypothetical protein
MGDKFKDKDDRVILAEKPGGGRTFSPIEVEGTKGYSVRQLFESPDDEAFYGLGQHQSDEFNYKGKKRRIVPVQHQSFGAVYRFKQELRNFMGQLFVKPFWR